jgi:hypothetical protein
MPFILKAPTNSQMANAKAAYAYQVSPDFFGKVFITNAA